MHMVFSNGVTLAGGNITVPAGVTSFTVTVPTVNDTVSEPAEAFTLTIGGVTGTGTIIDNDEHPDHHPRRRRHHQQCDGGRGRRSPCSRSICRMPASTATSFALALADGSASLASDYTNALVFSNGVTLSGWHCPVPAGVTSFTVTVPTVNDAIYEPTEAFTLAVGGVAATGTITDNDGTPTITTSATAASPMDGPRLRPCSRSPVEPHAQPPTSFATTLGRRHRRVGRRLHECQWLSATA